MDEPRLWPEGMVGQTLAENPGAIEGACKHVVGKRLKQSGMIWTRAGSSATLALRICWLNGQWDSFWEQKPLAA
jgi:hypothetical protein